MSEYQYYDFQAIDRPLNEQELEYIGSLSRRVELTPTQVVVYWERYSEGENPWS